MLMPKCISCSDPSRGPFILPLAILCVAYDGSSKTLSLGSFTGNIAWSGEMNFSRRMKQ